MRLIDAEALKEAIDKEFEKANLSEYEACVCVCEIYDKCIDNAPTVEENSIIDGLNNEIDDLSENLAWYINERNRLLKERRPQGEWIPVSERLPEEKLFNPSGSYFGFEFEEVLCTTIWGNVRTYHFGKPIGHDKPHFWHGGEIMDEYVIAWQYKPEPYKKGGAE